MISEEYICEKCNGTGQTCIGVSESISHENKIYMPGTKHRCEFCNGKGKLDWIENILGVDDRFIYRTAEEDEKLRAIL